jgi:hypothetical protein
MTAISSLKVRVGFVALVAPTTAAGGGSSAEAGTAGANAGCTTVVKAAPWTITSLGSGSHYTLKAFERGPAIATVRRGRGFLKAES